jgi:hypothetical protein
MHIGQLKNKSTESATKFIELFSDGTNIYSKQKEENLLCFFTIMLVIIYFLHHLFVNAVSLKGELIPSALCNGNIRVRCTSD